jgi:hypothetical protein
MKIPISIPRHRKYIFSAKKTKNKQTKKKAVTTNAKGRLRNREDTVMMYGIIARHLVIQQIH